MATTLAPKQEAFRLGRVRGKRPGRLPEREGRENQGSQSMATMREFQSNKENWELKRTVIECGEVVIVDQTVIEAAAVPLG